MIDQVTAESLKDLPLFTNVAADLQARFAALCEEVRYQTGDAIFHQNDEASDVYLILEGEVSLVVCNSRVACRQIGVARAGDMIGWSTVLGRRLLSDMACTLTPVTALKVDGQRLLAFCQENPDFGFEFMRLTALAIAERLSGTRDQLMEVHGVHLPKVQLESD